MLLGAAALLLHQVLYADAAGLKVASGPAAVAAGLAADLVPPEGSLQAARSKGADLAFGRFSGGSAAIGLESGVVLSTGNAGQVEGDNRWQGVTTSHVLPGDRRLDAASGRDTHDAAVLELSVVPASAILSVHYVYATEESGVRSDVFSVEVAGHECETPPPPRAGHGGTEMGYISAVQSCTAPVEAGSTVEVRIAIADAGDPLIDSALFVSVSG